MVLQRFDLTPLFKTSIGFDQLVDALDGFSTDSYPVDNYPPYNIVKVSQNNYVITMAVAGFAEEDIEIIVENDKLTVKASSVKETGHNEKNDDNFEFLYRGIAERAFERHFSLADHVKVIGAHLDKGLLNIDLQRDIPQEMKAKKIPITGKSKLAKKIEPKQIESSK